MVGSVRREYLKPIMLSGGLGRITHSLTTKAKPRRGLWLVKLGGPAVRIGVGGGAASSACVGTAANAGLPGGAAGGRAAGREWSAVQRGDPLMATRLDRVVRRRAGLGALNPLLSIHAQGAGGIGNSLQELADPAGAIGCLRAIPSADATRAPAERWVAESQGSSVALVGRSYADPECRGALVCAGPAPAREHTARERAGAPGALGAPADIGAALPHAASAHAGAASDAGTAAARPDALRTAHPAAPLGALRAIARRGGLLAAVVGMSPGGGVVRAVGDAVPPAPPRTAAARPREPLALPLADVRGDVPPRAPEGSAVPPAGLATALPVAAPAGGVPARDAPLLDALSRALRALAAGSERFLASMVDRSVGGLVIVQPRLGPLHTPVADAAVAALRALAFAGSVVAVGEQPPPGLAGGAHAARMARLPGAGAVTNMLGAPTDSALGLRPVRASGD